MNRSAVLSSDGGLYRYSLRRTWEPGVAHALFIMLNPSTADATVDDPTIRRCMGFAAEWGLGGIYVANLYAYRATKPADLWRATDPVGPDNDQWLHALYVRTRFENGAVIAAWGANAKPDRVAAVCSSLGPLDCLGVTKAGAPRHPLYLRADATPTPWSRP